jgi:hypothetical protein
MHSKNRVRKVQGAAISGDAPWPDVGSLNFAISKMTSPQIAETQKLAGEWKPK